MTLAAAILAALVQATPLPSPSASPSASPSPLPWAQITASPATTQHLYPGNVLAVAIVNPSVAVTVTIDNPIATWTIDPRTGVLTIAAGQTLGRATLTIANPDGEQLQIPLQVGLDAGKVSANVLNVQYTGDPVDPAWLRSVVQKNLMQLVQLQAGASPQTAFTLPAFLGPGTTGAFDAQIQITGTANYYPVTQTLSVSTTNTSQLPFAPQLLYYDDDPERLSTEGVLYRGHIPSSAPVRLYYYHENTDQPRDLLVVFTASQLASVHLIDASAGPNIDVMTVGHVVTRDFLTRKPVNEGVVVSLVPGAPYVAERFQLKQLDGCAGSIDIHLLSGGPVDVTVLSVPPNAPDAVISGFLGQPQLPDDGHHRTGAFALTDYGNAALTYTIGGPDASLDYGLQSPQVITPANGRDFGEYGVWRTIDFTVTNSSPQPATVYLYEQPMGGVVRSSFLVNAQGASTLSQVGCARVSTPYQIGDPLTVPPGQSHVVVQTMTDGGSNYPLRVGLTTTPPAPSPPPINAPDGCFPKAQPSPSPLPAPEPTG